MADLQGRVAPVSVSIAAGTLLRMLRFFEPERDWTVLARVYRQLKRTAVPSRDKLSKMVPATDLLALGIRLMETCAHIRSQQVYKAAQRRDGLVISTLVCCPVRNLTEIVIGRQLIFDGSAYRLEFTAAETNAGRSYHAAVPVELTPYIEDYLQVHRPRLRALADADGPGTEGRPFDKGTLYKILRNRTYLGEAVHNAKSYPGEHEPIVERATREGCTRSWPRTRSAGATRRGPGRRRHSGA